MPPPFKPPANAGAMAANIAFNYRVVDADGDGRITREELADYFRQFGGGAVQAAVGRGRPCRPPWTRRSSLSSTRTRTASSRGEELAAAASVLFPLDQDHDELLTPQELVPSLYSANDGRIAGPPPTGAMGIIRQRAPPWSCCPPTTTGPL